MIWTILESNFKLTLNPLPTHPRIRQVFFRAGGRNLRKGGVQYSCQFVNLVSYSLVLSTGD